MPKLDDVTLQANNLDPHVDIVSVELTVAEGPGRGQRLQLGPGTARIGSAPGSQLCITDPHVSRMHCEVRIERDHATLVDLGSKNGTWVDGVRIQSAWLAPGSLIRLGSSAVRVEYGRAPLHVAVSTRTRFGGA